MKCPYDSKDCTAPDTGCPYWQGTFCELTESGIHLINATDSEAANMGLSVYILAPGITEEDLTPEELSLYRMSQQFKERMKEETEK